MGVFPHLPAYGQAIRAVMELDIIRKNGIGLVGVARHGRCIEKQAAHSRRLFEQSARAQTAIVIGNGRRPEDAADRCQELRRRERGLPVPCAHEPGPVPSGCGS